MKRLVVLVLLAMVGCKKELPPPKNEFEAFERKFVREYELLAKGMRARGEKVNDKDVPGSYRAVFIGPSGVFIDRKMVATLAEIDTKHAELEAAIDANAKLMPSVGFTGLAVTFDLDKEPAAVAMSALRLFAGRETHFNIAREDAEVPEMASHMLCGQTTLRAAPSKEAAERPQLSILFSPQSIWVGLSQLREFQEIPDKGTDRDFEKLETVLKEHKASDGFADRTDVELGFETGTAAQVLQAFDTLCKVGFIDIALLPKNQLSAVPTL